MLQICFSSNDEKKPPKNRKYTAFIYIYIFKVEGFKDICEILGETQQICNNERNDQSIQISKIYWQYLEYLDMNIQR